MSSRISEVFDWSFIKSELLGLCKDNIHIVTCNDGYTVQTFKQSGGEKVADKNDCKTDGSVKLATGGCILLTAILLI